MGWAIAKKMKFVDGGGTWIMIVRAGLSDSTKTLEVFERGKNVLSHIYIMTGLTIVTKNNALALSVFTPEK